MIIPTLCVGMHPVTLRVTVDAERPSRRYHAERGNDLSAPRPMWPIPTELIRSSYRLKLTGLIALTEAEHNLSGKSPKHSAASQ
jgi:uncharacterized protein (DUF2237 family)